MDRSATQAQGAAGRDGGGRGGRGGGPAFLNPQAVEPGTDIVKRSVGGKDYRWVVSVEADTVR